MRIHLATVVALSLVAPITHAGLFGPDKFQIVPADRRFETGDSIVIASRNNRISKKSIAGGMHLDSKGVYIDPAVRKDRASGTVLDLALVITNHATYDTSYGSPNSLGTIKEITFAPSAGPPIILPVSGTPPKWSDRTDYNPLTQAASTDITESGFATITLEQYQAIATAKTLAIQVTGSNRSVTYETSEIASSFIPNLADFMDKAILK